MFSFGVSILDKYAYFSGCDMRFADECKQRIMEARKAGRGAILAVSHIGGWALSGGKLAEYECPTGAVGVSNEHEYIRQMAARRAKRAAVEMIADAGDPMSMVAALGLLRRNGVLALHADRYAGGKFAAAELLGAKVRLPGSAYALAAKTGAPVISVFCVREGVRRYRMFCSPARFVENLRGAPFDAAAARAAQAYAADVEGVIKKYPRQWYNFYPFWEQ